MRFFSMVFAVALVAGCDDGGSDAEVVGDGTDDAGTGGNGTGGSGSGGDSQGGDGQGGDGQGGDGQGGDGTGGAGTGGGQGGDGTGGTAAGGAGGQGGAGTGGQGMGGGPSSDPCDPSPADDARCAAFDDARPGRLNEHVAVYADNTNEMVVFGGQTAVPENCGFVASVFSDETWIYDDACNGWTQVEGDGPGGRARAAAAYDGESMWVFGGRWRAGTSGNYTVYDELWRFEVATRTWSQIRPNSQDVPPGRVNHAMTYDASRNRLWIFGGNRSTSGLQVSLLNDVWYFDIGAMTWHRLATEGEAPTPRLFVTLLHDATRDQLITFGGADETLFNNDARYFDTLWSLDLATSTWSPLPDSGNRPAGRFWSRMVHLPESDQFVLFGGHDDQTLGNRNDTWIYDPNGEAWLELTAGDQFNAPANGFCDFPDDFTTIDLEIPERRNAHSLVFSQSCGHAVLFGGKTDCGAINDVWHYRDNAWTESVTADEGESCRRWRNNPDNCMNLCF
jgi:N-acetylneuraminic acid mutarotase